MYIIRDIRTCLCAFVGRNHIETNSLSLDKFNRLVFVIQSRLMMFISVINQLDAYNFCFTISLFHASTCFEHMCSKHVEA